MVDTVIVIPDKLVQHFLKCKKPLIKCKECKGTFNSLRKLFNKRSRIE